MEFTKLERAAIETILSESLESIDVLRAQFAASSVIKRDYTGVGFYTIISVPRSVPPVKETTELRDHLFGGAAGIVGPVEHPRFLISFHLWLDAGYLNTLEGVTLVGEGWPDESKIEVVG
jgi:hypothetical protein